MLIDARGIATDETIETDLCIIGAGPAGITIAREFVNTDVRVCLLESGGTEWESASMELAKGELAGYYHCPLEESRAMAFGGTSHFWPEDDGLRSRPLDSVDFETRPAVPHSGWPFGRSQLDPYYDRAHAVCGLGPPHYDVSRWEDPEASPRVPLAEDEVFTTVFKFTKDVGAFRGYLDDLSTADNGRVMLHAHAVELVVDHTGQRIDHVQVAGLWSSTFSVKAKMYVLAAGGIENARLLLLSRGSHKAGLGNQHDLVGRFFMEHLRMQSGVLVPANVDLAERLALYQRHFVYGHKIIGVVALRPETVRSEGLLNSAFYLRSSDEVQTSDVFRSMAVLAAAVRSPSDMRKEPLVAHVRNVVANPRHAVRAARARVTRFNKHPPRIQLITQSEQAPNPSSRVTLSESKDALGLPVARLDWRLSDLDHTSIRRAQEILNRECSRSRIGRIEHMLGEERPPKVATGHYHHMGTTRMHQSPRKGVVDPDCRLHGIGNLFVAGSSVFPTGGYANPTLTIVALGLRLVDRLRSELRV